MDAGKSTISGVFNGSRLLEIPFYQRAYVWGEEQWERFLGDMEFVTASKRPYFLGSIILKQASSGNTWSEVSEVRTVIDGQQRLTTMVIFFKALCAKIDADRLFERDFVLETGKVALRHGKYDREDFEKVVSAASCKPLEGSSAIILAYNYFLKNIDPKKIDRNTIKSNVQFVCIDLTEGEDEQQIFDTINSLGMRLTTAELLKNYFFNCENEQAFKECWEDVFEPTAEKREYWEQEVVTGRIKRTLIDLFFDAFLQILVQDKNRGVTTEDKLFYSRTSNLFQSYKDFIGKYCNGDKDEILDSMKAYAKVFESTFDPSCCDADIPSAPGVKRLNVLIFGLKNSTLIPYVLYVRKNAESPNKESEVYALLESYIVRRMLVQATTKNYNKLFTSLILNEVKDAEALRKALGANDEATTCMPSDDEVRTAFEKSHLYNIQSKGVLYLLESAIRPGMSSTALLGFNQYTLEHMMPKKWRNKWGALDEEAAARRDKKLLTLGNLAIITNSLNASIRDADWTTKKQGKGNKDGLVLCAAGLATMAGALEKESWDEDDIAERAEWLADKALEVWR
ncbi:DUF262 domain-containing protein [Collinsella sp. TM04-9]|uniref:DUF262 domain-containing protein n=1 Tax=unclassified Collinsella TaxID=2637548 RepID=UPI000E503E42|nr:MULTISPECIES: DUF262 domain-containing protein [unclassified Collinsella]RGJ85183.1 DUF262 domain-containing protein [Collinsella sp. TM04-9]RGJ94803.1 DUF262 domain-containing protein [Collinsella sp. TM04-29]